ncbi:Muniscin C-terminal mu homology domain-domain-containing protein [Absidia repens]|uniref:Muniscin C-terminal mu homology domain-domain-containing protein n=1 Tax=Absidia repens TaxID=90262 RepID=A0A1X2IDA1_9FUNG|nr:Muniscin C-terminal mu homology domain-domain-containing protein [Absidia repens]
MTETVHSTPYISAFLTERPKDGVDRIQTRLRSALKLNDEIADYFKERALVEDTYAKSLAKLNKKVFITDKQALGNLHPTWERLQKELFYTSTIHATFAAKILDDIEKSLRSAIVTNETYAEIRSMDPTFHKLVKEYDDRQGKMIKQKKVLEKNGKKPLDAEAKYTEAKAQLDATTLDWQQNSINYIQKFQSVDERRLSDIQNYLSQFETLQVDQMLKRVQLARDSLACLSDFSVENEILSFCGQPKTNYNPSSSIPSTMPPLDSTTSEASIPPAVDVLEPVESASPPSLLVDISDDPEPVHPQSTVSVDSITSTHTRQTTNSSLPSVAEDGYCGQSDMNSQQHHSKAPSIASSKKSNKQRKFLSTLSMRLKPKTSGTNRSNHQRLDLPDSASGKAPSFMDNASVYSIQEDESSGTMKQMNQHSNSLQTPPALRKISSFSDSFFNQPSSPPSQQQQHQQQSASTSNILVDDEGFSIPPPDRSPWTTDVSSSTTGPTSSSGEDQQDSSDLTSMDSASLHGTPPPPRFKLDIRTDSVVQEDATSSQVALTRVASMLKESNPTATSKRSRGRREIRSQLFLQGNSLSPGHPTLPPPTCTSSTVALEDHLITPTAILTPSGDPTTVNNNTHETKVSPFAHDDDEIEEHQQDNGMEQPIPTSTIPLTNQDDADHQRTANQPTINVRITEVIHAQLRQGQAQRVMVTGQVALLYEGPAIDTTTTTALQFIVKHNGTEITSLADCIQQVEETDQGMVYQWTPPIGTEHGYVSCIDYRQRQDEPSSSALGLVVPLLVKPMWKCDGDQARLIIKYSKPKKKDTAATTALGQVMMVTHVGGDCHGAQSMPTGQWMVDQQRMMWSLEANSEHDDDNEQVIRAKFATASQATPQPIAVRFEMQNQLASSLQVMDYTGTATTGTDNGTCARINKVDMYTKSGKYIAEV